MFDNSGDYQDVWLLALILSVVGYVSVFAIRDRPFISIPSPKLEEG